MYKVLLIQTWSEYDQVTFIHKRQKLSEQSYCYDFYATLTLTKQTFFLILPFTLNQLDLLVNVNKYSEKVS